MEITQYGKPRSRLLPLFLLLLLWGCGGNGSRSLPVSNPTSGVFAGAIVDNNGVGVSGARVSIGGIEAAQLTGADGGFVISDLELAVAPAILERSTPSGVLPDLEISVLRDGYDPIHSTFSVVAGGRLQLDLTPTSGDPAIELTQPRPQETFVLPSSCSGAELNVQGFVRLAAVENYRVDVVLLIDRSGSTDRDAFDVDDDGFVDTVLDAEVEAMRCFLEGLDFRTTRVCILQFNDSVDVLQAFSDDVTALLAALDTVGAPDGGTNFEAGLVAAKSELEDLITADASALTPPDVGVTLPAPRRAVVLVSDGIPTSHGVPLDTSDSNLTQSKDDRTAAIDAAQALGASSTAKLFGFSILPAFDSNLSRTTLPQCVAACGGGAYENIPDAEQLEESLCGLKLTPSATLSLANLTSGSAATAVTIANDGSFSGTIPIDFAGAPSGGTDPSTTRLNTLRLQLTAYSGAVQQVIQEDVTVRIIAEADATALTSDALEVAQGDSESVSDKSTLTDPEGEPLSDDQLRQFLQSEFEDAVEVFGVETFQVRDPTGGGAPSVVLTIDYVLRDACYQSDVGYFIWDPSNPPNNAQQALSSLTSGNVLFNAGDVGGSTCAVGSIATGTVSTTVTLPVDTTIVFFLIPDKTLASWQSNPSNLRPLFTTRRLNPGRFDQVLSYRSELGRTAAGASTTLVAPGSTTIFAFEDLSVARKRSDRDYSDVVFTVSAELVSDSKALTCP